MANRVEQMVETLAEDLLKDTVFEIVDVEYVKERDWYLRIYIDKEGGIGLDDCQEVSRLLDEAIEKQNILNDKYILEVSSPGIDRILKKEKDYRRELGKDVDVTLYKAIDGKKQFTGKLTGFSSDSITLDEDKEFKLADIAVIRLHIEF